jgi:hypothetical protein
MTHHSLRCAAGDEFLIRGVQLCGQPQAGTFTLTFRQAALCTIVETVHGPTTIFVHS